MESQSDTEAVEITVGEEETSKSLVIRSACQGVKFLSI